jgi:hypothetical protein
MAPIRIHSPSHSSDASHPVPPQQTQRAEKKPLTAGGVVVAVVHSDALSVVVVGRMAVVQIAVVVVHVRTRQGRQSHEKKKPHFRSNIRVFIAL